MTKATYNPEYKTAEVDADLDGNGEPDYVSLLRVEGGDVQLWVRLNSHIASIEGQQGKEGTFTGTITLRGVLSDNRELELSIDKGCLVAANAVERERLERYSDSDGSRREVLLQQGYESNGFGQLVRKTPHPIQGAGGALELYDKSVREVLQHPEIKKAIEEVRAVFAANRPADDAKAVNDVVGKPPEIKSCAMF